MQFLTAVVAFLFVCAVDSRKVYNPDNLGLRPNCDDVYRATNYTNFQHVKTGLFLSYEGIASRRYTFKNVFQLLTYIRYDTFEYNTPFVTGVALFSKPWFNTTENRIYAMDITGGCQTSAAIRTYLGTSMGKNRLFTIHEDGSIGTTCNDGKDWRLVIHPDGYQVMRPLSEVDSDAIQWKLNFLKDTQYLPY